MRGDRKNAHELRTQGHHDHEIHDRTELNGGKNTEKNFFLFREHSEGPFC